MKLSRKMAGAGTAVTALVLGGMLLTSFDVKGQGNSNGNDDESKIQQGFAINPVPLNMHGKNRALVGLGSYLVNAIGGCNDCHTNPSFAPGGNPYLLGQHKAINATAYLGGGQAFGPFISRNLTPDKSGLPEGGRSFSDFLLIMRTGVDLEHLHPNLPAPLNGALLQVMPWPTYQSMTDRDLRAIYEYLSAIPCVEGGPGEPADRCH
jgi:hypothetical protein